MGSATCPEGTPCGSLLAECGLMALCSTWLSGEVGASSEQPASARLPTDTHRHFHTLTSDLTYSWDVPGALGGYFPPLSRLESRLGVGEEARSPLLPSRFLTLPPNHSLISFDVILLQLFKYFLKLFNPWGRRLRRGGEQILGSVSLK